MKAMTGALLAAVAVAVLARVEKKFHIFDEDSAGIG